MPQCVRCSILLTTRPPLTFGTQYANFTGARAADPVDAVDVVDCVVCAVFP
ncbi:hypothetical protein [Sorangium sp. So ce1153]|uniref:hypothetical protein n=1 Tax=Sorangium sp. So ce1153 TaxID=3133333 RepID=UPI003F62E5AF